VDKEASLSVIENQEFIAMRAAEKLWLVPTTTEDQLCDLVKDDLIQEDFADWKVLGQHRVPTPSPGEIVLLSLSFELASACLLLPFFIVSSIILALRTLSFICQCSSISVKLSLAFNLFVLFLFSFEATSSK
jgi:hypothetical protein